MHADGVQASEDIETHSWLDGATNKGGIGQFGWYTMRDEATLKFARIVQIAWVVGKAYIDAPVVTKSYLVKPDGFEIATKAINFHHITNEEAAAKGKPLQEVLLEFMSDVKDACMSGGRVCAHQIEFVYALDQNYQCLLLMGAHSNAWNSVP